MYIYHVMLFLLVLLSLTEIIGRRSLLAKTTIVKVGSKSLATNLEQIIALVLLVSLTSLSAIRDVSVGVDLTRYIPRYISLGMADWSELFALADSYSFEYGFAVFCKFLYLVNPAPGFFLAVTSVISGLGFYQLSRLSKLPITTLFIIYSFGVYGSSMNVVRQYLAFSILMVGIKFIFERKLFPYLLVVALAMSFHTMSLLFVMLYFLYGFPFNTKWFIAVILGCGVFMVLGEPLIRFAARGTSFEWYLERMGQGSGEKVLVLLFAMLCGAWIYHKRILESDNRKNICIWALVVALILNSMALNFAILARAMEFFTPFTAVLVPDILVSLRKHGIKFYVVFVFAVLMFYTLYFELVLLGGDAVADAWYPYLLREMS